MVPGSTVFLGASAFVHFASSSPQEGKKEASKILVFWGGRLSPNFPNPTTWSVSYSTFF